jgi:hypothetical protein
LDTFVLYQAHGNLPEAGGLLDQAATWVDAVSLVTRRVAANRQEDEERRERDLKKHGSKR